MPPSPTLEYDGFDRAEETLAQAASGEHDASYIRILRIDSPTSMPSVGRRQWNVIDFAGYIGVSDDETGQDMRGMFDDALDVDSPAETVQAGNAAKRDEDNRMIAAAVMRWVKDIVRGQMGPDADEVVFALELRGPKGMTRLATPRVRCRRVKGAGGGDAAPELSRSLDPNVPLEVLQTRTDIARTGAVVDPDSRAWNVLTEAWLGLMTGHQRAMGIMQSGYAHQMRVALATLQDVRGASSMIVREMLGHVARLQRDLATKDELIRRLGDELIGFRIDLAGLGLNAMNDEKAQLARLDVAKQFIGQIGTVGELYLAGKLDLEPELVPLLLLIRKHPKLMACLKNPKVQKALENEELVAGIVDTLEGVAASIPDEPPAGGSSTTPPPAPEKSS